MPATVPDRGRPGRLDRMIPAAAPGLRREHPARARRAAAARRRRRPATACSAGCTRSPASHVEVALKHPVAADRQRARLRRRRTSSTQAHEHGMLVAALAGKAEHARQPRRSAASTSWWRRATRPAGTPARSPAWCWCPRWLTRWATGCRCWPPAGSAAAARSRPRWPSAPPGVWMGSCWLTTAEYQIGPPQRCARRCSAAGSSDTVRSRIYTGKPARLLRNRWTEAWAQADAPATAADAAAEPAGQRGAPAADARRRPERGADAGRADRRADERGPPGGRGHGAAPRRVRGSNVQIGQRCA